VNVGDRLADALLDVGIVGAAVKDRGPAVSSSVKIELSHADARKRLAALTGEEP
jgi:hypothetical protein